MSETPISVPHKKPIRSHLANTLIAATVAGGMGAAVEHGMYPDAPAQPTVTAQEIKDLIHQEAAKKEFADQQAARYTKALNEKNKAAYLSILNGEVSITQPSVSIEPQTISNPIVLYAPEGVGAQDTSDLNADTLDDQYIGVVGNDVNGDVVVSPFLFKKETDNVYMDYVSHNQSTPTLGVVAVAEATGKAPNQVNQIYAYDEQMGQWLNNPDGTPLIVSYSPNMK
jgi:hypothetical protein